MKKRLRKKKQKHNYKNIDIEISDIECLEEDFNYIVTFKVYENNRCYKSQILKYMPAFKYIHFMRNDCTKRTLLKGVVDSNKRDLSLFIPKYKIKARDSVLCLDQCVSSKDRIKIVSTIDTPSDIMVITDPKEEIIQKFLAAGYTVITRSENEVKLLKPKTNESIKKGK